MTVENLWNIMNENMSKPYYSYLTHAVLFNPTLLRIIKLNFLIENLRQTISMNKRSTKYIWLKKLVKLHILSTHNENTSYYHNKQDTQGPSYGHRHNVVFFFSIFLCWSLKLEKKMLFYLHVQYKFQHYDLRLWSLILNR